MSAPTTIHTEAFNPFNPSSLVDTTISLSTAFVLGSLIGQVRQVGQRPVGWRTNTGVAVGAAVFVDRAAETVKLAFIAAALPRVVLQ